MLKLTKLDLMINDLVSSILRPATSSDLMALLKYSFSWKQLKIPDAALYCYINKGR